MGIFNGVNGDRSVEENRVARAQRMVSEQASCSVDQALALMENTAVAADTTLDQLATEILDGKVRFD